MTEKKRQRKMHSPLFYIEKVGKWLSNRRREAEYKNTSELAHDIASITGVSYSKDAIDAVEQGRRLPSLELFFGWIITTTAQPSEEAWANATEYFLKHTLKGDAVLLSVKGTIDRLVPFLVHLQEWENEGRIDNIKASSGFIRTKHDELFAMREKLEKVETPTRDLESEKKAIGKYLADALLRLERYSTLANQKTDAEGKRPTEGFEFYF